MVKYKLIKIYPGSRALGYILEQVKNGQDKPDNYYLNGHWLTPSEHSEYWQEVKELTLLEEAKLRYPIGTKFKNASQYRNDNNKIFEITSTGKFYQSTVESHGCIGVYFNNEWLYCNNQWAEIVDDFVLPEEWKLKVNDESINEILLWRKSLNLICMINNIDILLYDYINQKGYGGYGVEYKKSLITNSLKEITFEQFKKYVLKEESKTFENPCVEILLPEKIVKKDYEILSLSLMRSERHQIRDMKGNSHQYILSLLNCQGNKIHSVRRFSDGEIFTIGDKLTDNFIIREFEIKNDNLLTWFQKESFSSYIKPIQGKSGNSQFNYINSLKKAKQPLFTTEDGVDIFAGMSFYYVCEELELYNTICCTDEKKYKNAKQFSTKKKAEEYILLNKPILTLSEIWDNLKVKDQKEVLKFVKEKLNI